MIKATTIANNPPPDRRSLFNRSIQSDNGANSQLSHPDDRRMKFDLLPQIYSHHSYFHFIYYVSKQYFSGDDGWLGDVTITLFHLEFPISSTEKPPQNFHTLNMRLIESETTFIGITHHIHTCVHRKRPSNLSPEGRVLP